MKYLEDVGIYSLGTMRCNRIPGKKGLQTDIGKKIRQRSYFGIYWSLQWYACHIHSSSGKIIKFVSLVSTYIGSLPTTVKRYNKKTKSKENVLYPDIFTEYKKHMGGVDLIDSFIGSHKIIQRSKK